MTDAAMVERRRRALVRQTFFLEYITLAWMVVEAVVAIGSGVAARSITLLAFGIDRRDRAGLGGRADLAAQCRVAPRHGVRSNGRTRGKPYRRGAAACARGLYRAGGRMEYMGTPRGRNSPGRVC